MTQHQQIIQLAKQSALKKFALLIQRMAQHSEQGMGKALSVESATTDYPALNAARYFLRNSGNELLQRIEAEYTRKMEQALGAMVANTPVEVERYTAATLTLIDDKTINRQIEVGHLVVRLSASCSESLGRINIIISQLLEKAEVKEKDNPFRPELIAHTMHDVFYAMVEHENVRESLMTYATNSLGIYLPEFYDELCEVFKSGGISPKIYTRPTSKNPYLDDRQNRPVAERRQQQAGQAASPPDELVNDAAAPNVLPILERLLQLMQPKPGTSGQSITDQVQLDAANVSPLLAFQGMINSILNTARPGGVNSNSAVSPELMARLNEFQNMAANGRAVDGHGAPLGNQLFAVSEQIGSNMANPSERMALELVAVLFELILRDEQIPESMRSQIGQLQIPFVKSAMLDSGTLQEVDHPTRRLLNHMGMVSVGLSPESGPGQEVGSEIARIVKTILADFRQDTGIFTNSLDQLKQFMSEDLARSDAINKRNIDAIEAALRINNLTCSITESVSEVLLPMNLDQRIVTFCLQRWVHVLVKASIKISNAKDDDTAKSLRIKLLQYFNALPDLVWSAQEKSSTQDRLALIRLLPKLVKIITNGLTALQLTDQESKSAMDQLLAVHAQVLANTEVDPLKHWPTQAELRELFKFEAIQEAVTTSKAIARPPIDSAIISAYLTKKGVTGVLDISPADGYAANIEHEWLADMQVGTRVECKIERDYEAGRLIWVDKHQSLYMFRLDKSPNPLIYCPVALSKALRNGVVAFVETAPTFERAITALLQDLEMSKKTSAQ